MADNYLITGYWGVPHVTAENDRGINAAMFGKGRFVLSVGEQFNAEYVGNNTIRMYDGKLMNNGAAGGIPVGEYIDLLISNAGQGMKRNDLIVFQYEQDASTLIESGTFVVVQGEETSGTASDPVLTQEDLLSGTATFDQFPLWRVSVSGTTISAPVQLFEVYGRDNHEHEPADIIGVPKNNFLVGGTNGGMVVKTPEEAAKLMGLAQIATGSYAGTWEVGVQNQAPIELTFDFVPKFIMISGDVGPTTAIINVTGNMGVLIGYSKNSFITQVSVSGTTVSFQYSSGDGDYAVGMSGRNYTYFAIG